MKDLVIIGAGGFGRERFCLINSINKISKQWNFLGFIDKKKMVGTKNEYGTVIATEDDLNSWNTPIDVVFAIGNAYIVSQIVNKLNNFYIEFPNIYADDIIFLDKSNLTIGKGNIIGNRTFVSCDVIIGDFNQFNHDISIGHDVIIGNKNIFNPYVQISGSVKIGDDNLFGVNSSIIQGKSIGSFNTLGMGSVLLSDMENNCTMIGVPAKKLYI
jgi:sugar O-acyltransferase (sialic acid O-acetyltransferase NeuD family)